MSRRAAALAAALLVAAACASVPTAPAGLTPPPAAAVGWRAVGTLHVALPAGSATVDVALLTDRRARVRLEAMLPTGTPAAMLWVERGTWVAADPTAGVAYRGTVAEVVAAAELLPPLLQAGMALGLAVNFLNLDGDFATIWNPAASPTTAAFSGTALRLSPKPGGGELAVGEAEPWRVSFLPPPDSAPWPEVWRVSRQEVRMEVRWHRLTALSPVDARLLQPRLPSSFVLQPLPAAAVATTTVAPPRRNPPPPPPPSP